MKFFLRHTPIERKLTILTLITTGVALLLSSLSILIYEQFRFRNSLVQNQTITARMSGANGAAALSFDDPDSAEQTLQSFSANHRVIAALLYRRDGSLFARYERASTAPPLVAPPVEHNVHRYSTDAWGMLMRDMSHDYLEIFEDITLAGETIGTIYVRHDLSVISERRAQYAKIIGFVIAGATVLALLLTRRLQRSITGPVVHLADVIRRVATDRNYAIRADAQGSDEFGKLTEGFNEMLSQIQDRDRALQEAHTGLEQRVQERTRELEEEIAERQRTEAERDRFFTLSLDLLCIVDLDGCFQRLNPAFQAILGFSDQELLALPFLDLVHPDDRANASASLRQLAEGQTIANLEIRFLCIDSTYRWIAWSATPVPGETIVYAYGRDVSERKKAEAELVRLNRDLVDFSRQAGMAEVATSVLHNVGNVLNSVNISCDVISEKLRKSRVGSVAQIAELLRTHRADLATYFATDPAAKKLPDFLTKLAQRMADDQSTVLGEVSLLASNIEHIKEIVTVQQAYAKNPGGLRETLRLESLVEDALRMNAAALNRHHVRVEREYSEAPPVCLEKHVVLQILLNLVNNAKQAVTAHSNPDKRLSVSVKQADDKVLVSLSDNGVGISPDNMTRIFAHGFTTKKDGHGFGLHSGILAAKEMGGRLTARSEGLGKGATFTLELPLNSKINRPKGAA